MVYCHTRGHSPNEIYTGRKDIHNAVPPGSLGQMFSLCPQDTEVSNSYGRDYEMAARDKYASVDIVVSSFAEKKIVFGYCTYSVRSWSTVHVCNTGSILAISVEYVARHWDSSTCLLHLRSFRIICRCVLMQDIVAGYAWHNTVFGCNM
jgi:hypothetical protein